MSAPRPSGTPRVEVLLATWNGAAFLPQLLESLRRQTFTDFRILARDDGSTDGTVELLREAANRGEGPALVLVEPPGDRLGPAASFGRLMEASSAPWVMPCDQDDVWDPEKVQVTLEGMEGLEDRGAVRGAGEAGGRAGPGVPDRAGGPEPLLVHTDLRVVDRELRELAPSFRRYQNLKPGLTTRLSRNLVQNGVVGCSLMANRALLDRALPVPPEALMHDWWLALVASAFGRVEPLPLATLAYRQHGDNQTGALRWSGRYLLRKGLRFLDRTDLLRGLEQARGQAEAFLVRYGPHLADRDRETLEAFVALPRMGWLRRRRVLLRYGLLKHGAVRNAALLARI